MSHVSDRRIVPPLTVLLGGARAGKSTFAERLAAAAGMHVTYLATSPQIEGDVDLAARIARHRQERPSTWTTIEEELDLASAIAAAPPGVVLVDCVTTWVGNLVHAGQEDAAVLAAADERVYNVRHPIPTDKVIDRYAMLVLCGRKHGLVCSVTRLVHFGPLPDDLRRKMDACAEVDAAMLAASQPGATLGEI